eukprot:2914085-Amphidinium_carterae.3
MARRAIVLVTMMKTLMMVSGLGNALAHSMKHLLKACLLFFEESAEQVPESRCTCMPSYRFGSPLQHGAFTLIRKH